MYEAKGASTTEAIFSSPRLFLILNVDVQKTKHRRVVNVDTMTCVQLDILVLKCCINTLVSTKNIIKIIINTLFSIAQSSLF